MAANLIPLDDAAKMLGMSAEQLTEVRNQNEIFGYRDGSSWKFKMEELQRYSEEVGIDLVQLGGGADLSDSSSVDEELEDILSDSNLVLDLSEDSEDLDLASESGLDLSAGGSDVLSGSDVEPGESTSDTGKMVDGGDDDLLLAEDDLFDDGDLSLTDDSGDISMDSDSSLEDSDSVLDDSSSEIGLAASDSGINLSPTDSGLSLEEEPLELGGSDIDSLELPEDDEMISLEADDNELATQLKADDDFMLTPVEDAVEDESSGSQVIALEDSEIYEDDSSQTLLTGASGDSIAPTLVAEDANIFGAGLEGAGDHAEPVAVPVGIAPTATPEAPYSIFNVLALMLVLGLLTICMMLSFDVARNMWNFSEPYAINNTLMDSVIQMVGLEP